MGILRTKTIEPATGSTLTLGASGDTITVSSDSIKANTFKDAGGNTLFTSDGAGTLSSVNSGLVGSGPILISTSTASDSSSIDITSGIDSTYDEYMFVFTDIGPATNGANFGWQVNADGESGFNEVITSSAFTSYNDEVHANSYSAVAYQTAYDQAQGTDLQRLASLTGSAADEPTAGVLHLFSPASTTYVKHFYARANSYYYAYGGYINDNFSAGYINTTSAIDEITFKMSTGNFDGVIQMYGIK
jgi:hypothetical protein